MKTTNRKRWHLVRAMTLTLVLAAPMAPKAEADRTTFYELPMVLAQAAGANDFVEDFEAALVDGQDHFLLAPKAGADSGSSHAWGEAGDNKFVARAGSSGLGTAITRAFMEFVIYDPQARGLIKVNLG